MIINRTPEFKRNYKRLKRKHYGMYVLSEQQRSNHAPTLICFPKIDTRITRFLLIQPTTVLLLA